MSDEITVTIHVDTGPLEEAVRELCELVGDGNGLSAPLVARFQALTENPGRVTGACELRVPIDENPALVCEPSGELLAVLAAARAERANAGR